MTGVLDVIRWAWGWLPRVCLESYHHRRYGGQSRFAALRGALTHGLHMAHLRWRYQGLRRDRRAIEGTRGKSRMAGSYHMLIDEAGMFTWRYIENLRDACEAIEECFAIIQILSGGDQAKVESAIREYYLRVRQDPEFYRRVRQGPR